MSRRDMRLSPEIISVKIFTSAEKYRIPLTADNYAVLYAYFAEQIPDLTAEITEAINQERLTPAAMKDLYQRYVSTRQQSSLMTQVQHHTQQILQDVLKGVLEISDSSSRYEKKLNNHSDGLAKATDITQLQTIISAILQDTRTMAQTNQSLRKEFEKAKAQSRILSRKLMEVQQAASMDALTGLFNRRSLDTEISRLTREFKAGRSLFSAIILDIDFFKRVNDTYGHQAGDAVLKTIGQIIRKGVKGNDFPSRYGGEEFVILLPDTNLAKACIVAEQLRIRISVHTFRDFGTEECPGKVTVSMGISEIKPDDNEKTIIDRADKALYLAKQSGRNTTKSEKDL